MTTLIREVEPFDHTCTGRRPEMLRNLHQAVASLSAITSVRRLIDQAPQALCRVGFDRAMVSRIDDAHWVVERYHSAIDPRTSALITDAAQNDPLRLGPWVIEVEMVRRRMPILVPDVGAESRVHPQLREMTQTTAYVAAPIMPEGEVVGFLHADRIIGDSVDELDLEVLALFAQQLSTLVHKAALLERVENLKGSVDQLRASLGGLVSGCLGGTVGLAPYPAGASEVTLGPSATGAHGARAAFAGDPRVLELLSARELEVLRLMAKGETNTRIASRLVISEGTVKSHVRHILRKLGAANRAEAVCRWLQRPDDA